MFVEKFKAIRAKSEADRKIPVYTSTAPRIKGNHNIILAATFTAVLLGALNISAAHAESKTSFADKPYTLAQSSKPQKGEGGDRPPREAMEACEGAKSQSACSFSGREGEVVKGKCMAPEANVPLACVPDNAPKKG